MTFEANLLRLGMLLAGSDFRNSTLSGTTHAGDSGSYQFMAVRLSTVTDLTVLGCTASGQNILGILQNKPSTGQAADVAYNGVSKAVGGSTFGGGIDLMVDSSGCLIPWTSAGNQSKVGKSMETVSTVGQIFAAFLYNGAGPGSVA